VVACVLALGAAKGHTGAHHLHAYYTWIVLLSGGSLLTFFSSRIPARWRARGEVKGCRGAAASGGRLTGRR
jgi:hypothetical protein